MAGGVGTRFWPKGTSKHPKQFLKIGNDNETMIQQTYRRIEGLINDDKIYIVTNVNYKNEVRKQLPKIPEENIICEPFGRNTAPCIGLASIFIRQFDPKGSVLVLAADHIIKNVPEFQLNVKAGMKFATDNGGVVTLAITPDKPETGYGYIQFDPDKCVEVSLNGKDNVTKQIYKVKTFAEKPDLPMAKMFIESGDFLWNSGMFIFRVDTIMKEFEGSLPDLFSSLVNIEKKLLDKNFDKILEDEYAQIKGISIDYGVMERCSEVYTIRSDFGWNDIGSWDEIYNISEKDKDGNVKKAKSVLIDTKNTLVMSEQKVIAAIGVEDLLIIDSEDGLLICKKGESQKVKEVVDYLRRKGLDQFI